MEHGRTYNTYLYAYSTLSGKLPTIPTRECIGRGRFAMRYFQKALIGKV